MPPLVRRARKSIRERRMKACLKELTSNLEKVEKRAHAHHTKAREEKRRVTGAVLAPIPRAISDGVMNPELYEIECRLHFEAGLPPPRPYVGYVARRVAPRRVGFVNFSALIDNIRKL